VRVRVEGGHAASEWGLKGEHAALRALVLPYQTGVLGRIEVAGADEPDELSVRERIGCGVPGRGRGGMRSGLPLPGRVVGRSETGPGSA
jgi:hypothetical protein